MFADSSHSGYLDSRGVYTTGEFGFLGIRIQCFRFKFRIQKFPGSCFVCKRQNESGNICFSVNVVGMSLCADCVCARVCVRACVCACVYVSLQYCLEVLRHIHASSLHVAHVCSGRKSSQRMFRATIVLSSYLRLLHVAHKLDSYNTEELDSTNNGRKIEIMKGKKK